MLPYSEFTYNSLDAFHLNINDYLSKVSA